MREVTLDAGTLMQTDQSPPFVPLGPVPAAALSALARGKIARKNAAPQPEIWGTLGPWNDFASLPLRGNLRFSRVGDRYSQPERSGEATCKLIEQVQLGRERSLGQADAQRVLERFVDLSDVWLGGTPLPASFRDDAHPALRLTLFLRPGEGALVALQHGRFAEGGVEFIQPEPTGNDHSCSARDRLDYRIPLPFDQRLVGAELDDAGSLAIQHAHAPTRIPPGTSLKILSFERGNSSSREVIARALGRLGRNRYRMLKWDAAEARFVEVGPDKVKRELKTLLLLHGTFSSSASSFGKLVEGGGFSWLENIALAGRRYGQVLAFDHQTVLDGLAANADALASRVGGAFSLPVDLVTHSRGGLLGKYLALKQPGLEVERAALTACANGVGYLSAARGLSRFLSVLYQFMKSSSIGGVIVALAQHSVEAVLSLDGLRVMIPGSQALLEVASAPVPPDRQQTVFLPVVGDYSGALLAQDGFFKRLAHDGLDLVIKAFLGAKHDWVVGTSAQGILAATARPGGGTEPFAVSAWHSTYYDMTAVRERIERFLLQGT